MRQSTDASSISRPMSARHPRRVFLKTKHANPSSLYKPFRPRSSPNQTLPALKVNQNEDRPQPEPICSTGAPILQVPLSSTVPAAYADVNPLHDRERRGHAKGSVKLTRD